MTSLSDVKQAEIIEAFKSKSRYLDDLLNIDNPYFEGMVNRIYPPELQLNKANTSDTEAPFLDLHLSISNGFVSTKIYKRDDFDFDKSKFGSTVGFLLFQCSNGVVRHPRDPQVSVATRFCRVLIFASSQYLSVIYLFHVMIHWWVRKPSRGPNYVLSHDRSRGRGWVPVKPV